MLARAHEHEPTREPYSPGIGALLSLGEKPLRQNEWADYRAMGIEEDDVAELIRMALDSSLGMDESKPDEAYGPVHAWRALGQLRAVEAIESLLLVLHDYRQDCWAIENIPVVLGMIGPAAVAPVARVLADSKADAALRLNAASTLRQIAQRHPEARAECVSVLVRRLEDSTETDEEINGFAVSALIDLKAAEALPIIQNALASGRVSEEICGDWEDVQIEFGLKTAREHPRDYRRVLERNPDQGSPPVPKPAKSKAKLKAERRARRGKTTRRK